MQKRHSIIHWKRFRRADADLASDIMRRPGYDHAFNARSKAGWQIQSSISKQNGCVETHDEPGASPTIADQR